MHLFDTGQLVNFASSKKETTSDTKAADDDNNEGGGGADGSAQVDRAEAADTLHKLPTRAIMSGRGLLHANLGAKILREVQVLDLSNNSLPTVFGLRELADLRFLDVSRNPALDISAVLVELQVRPTTTLVAISLLNRPDRPPAGHQTGIMTALGLNNPRLAYIEGHLVSPLARQLAFDQLRKAGHPISPAPFYGAEAALVATFADPASASFRVQEVSVATQSQYNPADVQAVLCWRNIRLSNGAVPSLPSLVPTLTALDLSYNTLTSTSGIGLEYLTGLRALDLSFNQIAEAPQAMAQPLQNMLGLVAIAVRGNPGIQQRPQGRIEFMAALPSVTVPNAPLAVVDTVITVEERVAAWAVRRGTGLRG